MSITRKNQTGELSGPGTGVSGGQFAAHTGSTGDVDADLDSPARIAFRFNGDRSDVSQVEPLVGVWEKILDDVQPSRPDHAAYTFMDDRNRVADRLAQHLPADVGRDDVMTACWLLEKRRNMQQAQAQIDQDVADGARLVNADDTAAIPFGESGPYRRITRVEKVAGELLFHETFTDVTLLRGDPSVGSKHVAATRGYAQPAVMWLEGGRNEDVYLLDAEPAAADVSGVASPPDGAGAPRGEGVRNWAQGENIYRNFRSLQERQRAAGYPVSPEPPTDDEDEAIRAIAAADHHYWEVDPDDDGVEDKAMRLAIEQDGIGEDLAHWAVYHGGAGSI